MMIRFGSGSSLEAISRPRRERRRRCEMSNSDCPDEPDRRRTKTWSLGDLDFVAVVDDVSPVDFADCFVVAVVAVVRVDHVVVFGSMNHYHCCCWFPCSTVEKMELPF